MNTPTRPLIRGPRERFRAEYRDRNHPDQGWQPGTVVYQGERLAVIALDDGTTRHVYDWERELRGLGSGKGQQGDRVADTDYDGINMITGQLDVCHACAGHGLLFVPDAQQPAITEQPEHVQDLTDHAYQLLEAIELAQRRGGLYFVVNTGERELTAYARTDHGSWFAADVARPRLGTPGTHRFSITSMDSLEASGLITVTNVTQDELPGKLLKALHDNGIGHFSSDWNDNGITLYRPEPTSDPYGKPERAAMEDVLRAALHWLYKTEQPAGAGITQHGIGSGDLPTIPNRRIGLLPGGKHGGPIITVKVAAPVKLSTYGVRNPLAPDELDEWAEVIRDLGYDVAETWPTDPGSESGSIGLAEAPHPSLTAAFNLYLQGCVVHSHDNPGPDNQTGGRLCRCPWWREPTSLLVPPSWPKPATP